MENGRLTNLKERVAREAAVLLYTSQEKEYRQAKRKAMKTLGVHILPSNAEIARELNKIAEETEGPSRKDLLLKMRKEALKIMKTLLDFHPKLVGSVWRGTAHHKSDIDIATFSSNSKEILTQLQKNGFEVAEAEWVSVTKRGEKESSFHIRLVMPSGNEAEIVVRRPEKVDMHKKCETYGDNVTGLSYTQLQKVLKTDPLQKFLPKHKTMNRRNHSKA